MKRTPLRHESPKQGAINRSLRILTRAYQIEHPACEFRIDENGRPTYLDDPNAITCGCLSITNHHRMGRGIHTLEVQYFLSACWPHHHWAETHKREAREFGYILYK